MDRRRHKHRKHPKPHKHHRAKFENKPQGLNLKRTFYKFRRFVLRHPLISSVGSILVSIFLFRVGFSNKLFSNNITEFRGWFFFFAFLIGLIGIIALIVWFRRNVPQLVTKHDINWRNR